MYLPVYPPFFFPKKLFKALHPLPRSSSESEADSSEHDFCFLTKAMLEFGVVILIFQNEVLLQYSKQIETPFFHMSLFLSVGDKQTNKKINHFKKRVPLSKANNVLAYWFKRWMYVRHHNPQYWPQSQWRVQATSFPLQRTWGYLDFYPVPFSRQLHRVIGCGVLLFLSSSVFWAKQQIQRPYWIESLWRISGQVSSTDEGCVLWCDGFHEETSSAQCLKIRVSGMV